MLNRHPLRFFEYYVKVVKILLSLLLVLQSPYWFPKIHILHIFGIFLSYSWNISCIFLHVWNILRIFCIFWRKKLYLWNIGNIVLIRNIK